MNRFFRWLRRIGGKQDKEAEKKALWKFVFQIYAGHDLSADEAKKNIEDGILEIVWDNGEHNANGILVSESGYIVTCYHCVEKKLEEKRVIYRNRRYRIKRVCADDVSRDLALVKIDTGRDPVAGKYKFLLETEIRAGSQIPIVLLCRREGKLQRTGGFLSGWKFHFIGGEQDQYVRRQATGPGDSGAAIVTTEGELAGIHAGVCVGDDGRFKHGSALSGILSLIARYAAVM
jgi:S1-C subfamily serine protease